MLSRLVRKHIGLFLNLSVLAIGFIYLSTFCLVFTFSLGLNQFLCLLCFSATIANLIQMLVFLVSRVSSFASFKALLYVSYWSPKIIRKATFCTLSISCFSCNVIDPCQAGTAYSRMLLHCLVYISINSGGSTPSSFSLLTIHSQLEALFSMSVVFLDHFRSDCRVTPSNLISSTTSNWSPPNFNSGWKSRDLHGLNTINFDFL